MSEDLNIRPEDGEECIRVRERRREYCDGEAYLDVYLSLDLVELRAALGLPPADAERAEP